MAQNPMQRKMTNSFLLGMFITLLIAAIIVGLLLFRINKLNTEKETLESSQVKATKTVYVASETIAEGDIAYGASNENGSSGAKIEQRMVTTDIAQDQLLTSEDLETYNEQTGEHQRNQHGVRACPHHLRDLQPPGGQQDPAHRKCHRAGVHPGQ